MSCRSVYCGYRRFTSRPVDDPAYTHHPPALKFFNVSVFPFAAIAILYYYIIMYCVARKNDNTRAAYIITLYILQVPIYICASTYIVVNIASDIPRYRAIMINVNRFVNLRRVIYGLCNGCRIDVHRGGQTSNYNRMTETCNVIQYVSTQYD